jgi:hypothetical protein
VAEVVATQSILQKKENVMVRRGVSQEIGVRGRTDSKEEDVK